MQAGWAQATLSVGAGLTGLNIFCEAAGMQACLREFCIESLVTGGDDFLRQVMRFMLKIQELEVSISVDVTYETCLSDLDHHSWPD